METMDLIFWGICAVIIIAEIIVVIIFKLKKDGRVREWLDPAFYAIIIAIILRLFVIQAFKIPSSSMENTLLIGDQIMAIKAAYSRTDIIKGGKSHPKRGDVVIFKYPEDKKLMFIKRCIGIPGDVIMITKREVYVNGKKLNEPYIFHKDIRILGPKESIRDYYGPVTVAPDNYFMMGDNRDFSADSRYWGFVPSENIRGKAWIVYWPPSRWKVIKHVEIK